MSLIGVHVSNILEIQSNIWKKVKLFQIFVSPSTDYQTERYTRIIETIKNRKIHILVHASYSINIARDWKSSDPMVQQLITEIRKSHQIGAFAIVVHTGKSLDIPLSRALNNMYTLLLYVHEETKGTKVQILIETPAGQGTETLVKIQDICDFMNKFYKHPKKEVVERFGLCVDTCHVFAAGHDLRKVKETDSFFNIIEKTIGIEKIKACHLNDSKRELGSKIDRHENIGQGEIGSEPLNRIIKFMKSLEIPIIFETPSDLIHDDYMLALMQ
mgnify:CR=1 FL=1